VADGYVNRVGNSHRDAVAYRHIATAKSHQTYSHANSHHAKRDRFADGYADLATANHSDGDTYFDTDAYTNRHGDANTNADAHSVFHTDSDADGYGYPNGHRHSDSNGHINTDADEHTAAVLGKQSVWAEYRFARWQRRSDSMWRLP